MDSAPARYAASTQRSGAASPPRSVSFVAPVACSTAPALMTIAACHRTCVNTWSATDAAPAAVPKPTAVTMKPTELMMW